LTFCDLVDGENAELWVGDLPVGVRPAGLPLLLPREEVLPGRAALLLLEASSF